MHDVHHHNGPTSVRSELESCPTCGQTLPNGSEGRRIRAKLDAEQRARERQWETDRVRIAATARSEALTEAAVSNQQRFDILLKENARLKEDMQTTVDEQVKERVADREAKFDVERAIHRQVVDKLKTEVAKFARIGEQHSPQRLGEMTELEIFNGLKKARRRTTSSVSPRAFRAPISPRRS
jgi:hypothetical protein